MASLPRATTTTSCSLTRTCGVSNRFVALSILQWSTVIVSAPTSMTHPYFFWKSISRSGSPPMSDTHITWWNVVPQFQSWNLHNSKFQKWLYLRDEMFCRLTLLSIYNTSSILTSLPLHTNFLLVSRILWSLVFFCRSSVWMEMRTVSKDMSNFLTIPAGVFPRGFDRSSCTSLVGGKMHQ